MTRDEIEKLKALEREATKGPWAAAPVDHDPELTADLKLSAAMRNALPRLLEERERLLEALHAALDHALRAGCRSYLGEVFFSRLNEALAFAEAGREGK